jgi:RNA recognition motif-containing protein
MRTSHQLLNTDETNKQQPSSTWTQLGYLLLSPILFIMSFLTRLFGIGKKKDEFRGEKDETSGLRQEVEIQTPSREQVTPSPKGAFLRTAGVISKDAHDEKTPIEITVDRAIPSATVKAEPALPAASSTEGSTTTKVEQTSATEGTQQGLPEPGQEDSKNTLVIKNLPFKFTKPELDQLLSTHQAKSKNVRMLRDGSGRFTGIAFIRCPSKEEAGRLIIGMNNLDIGGRSIQVEFKKKKKKNATPAKKEGGIAPSATTAPVGPPMVTYPPQGYYPPPEFQGRSYISASGNLRTSGGGVPLRSSNMLTSSASSVEDEEYLAHMPYGRRRSLASSTSSVDDEKYLSASTDDATNRQTYAYPHSRLSLSSSGGVQNPRFSALPNIRPVRQPIGPDGKSIGFSNEYRRTRTAVNV